MKESIAVSASRVPAPPSNAERNELVDDRLCPTCGARRRFHPDGLHPVAAPPSAPDTARLDWLEAEAFKRQLWCQSDVMPQGSLAFDKWGHHRWQVIGQGLNTNNLASSTIREAIDQARNSHA